MKKYKNILLISTDQHRADAAGIYGNPVIKTPNIDRLGKEGVVFTNAFTCAPVCGPSRTSILTGCYPHTHRSNNNDLPIAKGQVTLIDLLNKEGYLTAAVGKMHFAPPEAAYGLKYKVLTEEGRLPADKDAFQKFLKKNGFGGKERKWDWNTYHKDFQAVTSPLPEECFDSTFIGNEAVDFIKKKGNNKFFLWASFVGPHLPFVAPKPFDVMYDPKKVPMPHYHKKEPGSKTQLQKDIYKRFGFNKLNERIIRKVTAYYYGQISLIDKNIGKIVRQLEEQNLLKNTLIIFTSDHGEMLGDHKMLWKGPYMYDGIVKIPFICRMPGTKHKKVNAMISNVDILPTIMEYLGLPVPEFVQGKGLSGLVKHGRQEDWREAVFSELGKSIKMIRTKDWKYVYYYNEPIRELYNLRKDPYEYHNLAYKKGYGKKCREMENKLLAWMIDTENKPVKRGYKIKRTFQDKFKTLYYDKIQK
ncbi:MAG: hypothetical protein A2252_06745 [Elusimicrobia bacterium RIFOXYA2_FULL_39_19]|nr:MAG: hypothetical protein A2252_06745 [Elusimicrobia bacterium RIFOXYA2_FULL_39_19]